MGPTWGPSGADRTLVGPILAPWTLLSGLVCDELIWGLVSAKYYFNRTIRTIGLHQPNGIMQNHGNHIETMVGFVSPNSDNQFVTQWWNNEKISHGKDEKAHISAYSDGQEQTWVECCDQIYNEYLYILTISPGKENPWLLSDAEMILQSCLHKYFICRLTSTQSRCMYILRS